MSKLRLNLDALAVETFDPVPARPGAGRGTVHGLAIGNAQYMSPYCASYPDCPSPLCVDTPMASCDGSCRATCAESCNGSCNSCVASCDGGMTCYDSCNGTCEMSCQETCKQSCGPLCIPPDPWVAGVR